MMRKFIIASCAVLMLSPALAQTGTPKTVTDLTTELNTTLPDNNVGSITPLVMRQMLVDIIASYGNLTSASNFTAAPTVPTAAFGTNTTQAASTAFVQANGGGTLLNNLPQFTTVCNPTGITAPAQACPAITAAYPLSISAGIISVTGTFTVNNTILGFNAGISAFSGTGNTGYGVSVLPNLTVGGDNTAAGASALHANTSGSFNTGYGFEVLFLNTTGVNNTGVGYLSLAAQTTANANTGVGFQSLVGATTGSANSALGSQACNSVTTGSFNICIGAISGAVTTGITTGSDNVVIGGVTGLSPTLANAIILADGAGTIHLDWNNTTAASWTQHRTNFSERFYTTYGTPTIASGACGTGTNGVITSGHNQSGLVTIGAAATTTCTVNFSTTFSTIPDACVVFPANAAAAATGTTVAYVSSISTTQWVITGSALANTAYRYLCI